MESKVPDLGEGIVAHHEQHKTDIKYMIQSIGEAKKSERHNKTEKEPLVGAVVVTSIGEVYCAHRSEIKKGDHAEYTLFEKYKTTVNFHGATLFTTLEPCTTRNHPKVPCAHWIWKYGISKVFVGILDPNPDICGHGIQYLRDQSIMVELYPDFLQSEIMDINKFFMHSFVDNHLRLVSYSCPAKYTGSSSWDLSQLVLQFWGDPAPTMVDMQHLRVEYARSTGLHGVILHKAEQVLNPGAGDSPQVNHQPVALREISLRARIKFRNTSSVPLDVSFSDASGELKSTLSTNPPAENTQLRYKVCPVTKDAVLHPKEEMDIAANVYLSIHVPKDIDDTRFAFAKVLFEGSDSLEQIVFDVAEIPGLTIGIRFFDGTEESREFSIRIENPEEIPRPKSPLDERFLKEWDLMEQELYKAPLNRLKPWVRRL